MDLPEKDKASSMLLVQISPCDVAMFRFLLEARDNLALFTTLDRQAAILKVRFAADGRQQVLAALHEIAGTIPISWQHFPACNNF